MNVDRLLAQYERIADTPDAVPRLRRFILDVAVRGKLVEQDPNEEPAAVSLVERNRSQREVRPLVDVPGWLVAPIPSLLQFQYGKGMKASERLDEGPVPVFGSNGIVGYCETPLTEAPAIIVGRKGSAGALNLCDGPSWTTDVAYFVEAPNYFVLRYLLIGLRTLNLGSLGKGIKPGLSRADVYDLPLSVPPLTEQHRIVVKVDELMTLCDRLEKARANREAARDRLSASSLARLDAPDPDPMVFRNHAAFALEHLTPLTTRRDQIKALRQTILNLAVRGKLMAQDPNDEPASELLERITKEKARLVKKGEVRQQKPPKLGDVNVLPFELKAGWQVVTIEQVLVELRTGPFGSSLHQSDYQVGGVPVVNPASIQNEYIVPIEKMAVGVATLNRLSTFKLKAGDIVMGRRGEMGRCAVVTDREAGWLCGTGSLVLRLPQCVYARFLVLLIGSPYVREYLSGSAVGATMQNLNQAILLSVVIGLPPLAEQHRIVARVDELMALCDRLETSLATADDTRCCLLGALLIEALEPGGSYTSEQAERAAAHG